jgi:hypothetical protein
MQQMPAAAISTFNAEHEPELAVDKVFSGLEGPTLLFPLEGGNEVAGRVLSPISTRGVVK